MVMLVKDCYIIKNPTGQRANKQPPKKLVILLIIIRMIYQAMLSLDLRFILGTSRKKRRPMSRNLRALGDRG